jgi:hypothetical protein
MGEKTNAYRFLMGNPEGKAPLRKLRRKWEILNKVTWYELDSSGSE